MSEHTKEPWTSDECGNIGAGEPEYILGMVSELPEANAKRIVACVNACAGMTNEELEDFSDGSLKFWIDDMQSDIRSAERTDA